MISLRWRLVAVALGVACVGLIAANLVVFGVVRQDLNNRIDRQLRDFSGRRVLVRAFGAVPPNNIPGQRETNDAAPTNVLSGTPRTRVSGLPNVPLGRPPRSSFETYAELRDSAGRLIAEPMRFSASEEASPAPLLVPASMGKPPTRPRIFEAADSAKKPYRVIYRALAVDSRVGKAEGLVFAIPTVDRDATLERLEFVQWVAVVATLAMLAFFASLLVRLGLRPLRRIETSAATIAAGDFSHRIEKVGSSRTEVGRLGLSLNAMLGQIEGAFAEKERSEQQLQRFIANASHELRTPLTSIRGYAELYHRGVGREGSALDNSMNRIASEATRMSALVEDMLTLARREQKHPIAFEPVDLASVVRELTSDHRAVDATRPLVESIESLPWINGHRFGIVQILTNLLANARTHTPEGTRICVMLTEDDNDAVLIVGDDGPGIEPEELPLVFEPFYRTDPARSRANGGAGLGLPIVASIVAEHRGTIAVDADSGVGVGVGVGVIFTIRIPKINDSSVSEPNVDSEGFSSPTVSQPCS